jgi:hypothetical protein
MRRLLLLLVCLCTPGMTGCAVNELRSDQDKIRCALLDLYTNQVMDNLVRAINGLPIIQLDYTNANASVTVKDAGSGSESNVTTHSNVFMIAAAGTATTTRMAVNTVMASLSHDHTNLVAVTALPVTTSVEAYNAYLQFLAIPGAFQITCTPPPEGAAHICRRYGKQYYWVPVDFKDLFFNLSLATSAERGRLLIPPPEYYSVTLQNIVGEAVPESGQYRITVQIDQEIPNEGGKVEFSDGKRAQLHEYEPPEPGLRLFETGRLVLYLDPRVAPLGMNTPADLQARLPLAVKVTLEQHRPLPPTTSQLLDQIPFDSCALPLGPLSDDWR